MTFTRTDSGISNLRLFYSVDIIIYTEGGVCASQTAGVSNVAYTEIADDIKFWSNIFISHGTSLKATFRATGSKTCLRDLCDKILNGSISHTAVARDRDLDDYLTGIPKHPLILHTKGYSWENDVFTRDLSLKQLDSMIMMAVLPESVSTLFNALYQKFERVGKHLARLELFFRINGKKFITGVNPERFLRLSQCGLIDITEIRQVIASIKGTIPRPQCNGVSKIHMCPYLNNYGKFLESLSFTAVSYFAKKYGEHKSIPSSFFKATMIDRYQAQVSAAPDPYYLALLSNLESALSR